MGYRTQILLTKSILMKEQYFQSINCLFFVALFGLRVTARKLYGLAGL